MNRLYIFAILGAILVSALFVFVVLDDDHRSAYRVEVIGVNAADEGQVVNFSALSTAEQNQFRQALNNPTWYETKPAIAAHAGETVRWKGERYSVVVLVGDS